MIYPDAEIDEGGNYLQAHVPFEIPASDAAEERLRWFAFDQNTGTEKVFFVFTREPLKDVPTEDELIAFCRNNQCPWQAGAAFGRWSRPRRRSRSRAIARSPLALHKRGSNRTRRLAVWDSRRTIRNRR